MPKVSIVLPTHNELANLKLLVPQIIRSLPRQSIEIIVVDDASLDGSRQWLESMHHRYAFIRPIFGRRLRGIGFALARGYRAATAPVIVSLDADLSLSPRIIPRLLKKINQGYDLVTCSRHHRLGKYAAPTTAIARKRIISRIANWLIHKLVPIGITDFSLDCRAITRDLWRRLKLKETTNIWLIEMIITSAITGAKITEIPVTFSDRRFGQSKLNLQREVLFTGYRVLGLIVRFYDHLFFRLS